MCRICKSFLINKITLMVMLLVISKVSLAQDSSMRNYEGGFFNNPNNFNYAIGIRTGVTMLGVNFKYVFNPSSAIEGVLGFGRGVCFGAHYLWQIPILNDDDQNFNFYYGAGANLGKWRYRDERLFTAGVVAVIGAEYKIPKAPIALSIDYKPTVNICGNKGLRLTDLGASLKYVF